MTTALQVSTEFFFPVGKLDIQYMTHRLTSIGNTQKKTEMLSNKVTFIINTLEIL